MSDQLQALLQQTGAATPAFPVEQPLQQNATGQPHHA